MPEKALIGHTLMAKCNKFVTRHKPLTQRQWLERMKTTLLILILIFWGTPFASSEAPQGKKNNIHHKLYTYLVAERIKDLGIQMLKVRKLPKDDVEIRIWRGFALAPEEGYIFHRKGESWSGKYISKDHKATLMKLNQPKAGWKPFIEKIEQLGLYTLPDESELEGGGWGVDHPGFMVEILAGTQYRLYTYHSPSVNPGKEAKALLTIYRIIKTEFNLEN